MMAADRSHWKRLASVQKPRLVSFARISSEPKQKSSCLDKRGQSKTDRRDWANSTSVSRLAADIMPSLC